jgi:hypothetical protein
MNREHSMKSRRAMLQAAGLAALVPLAATQAKAQDKLAPEMVMYQDTPKDGQKCAECLHFQPPRACAIVSGDIAPEGWCAVWAAKPS